MSMDFDVTFSSEEAFLWIMDFGLLWIMARSNGLKFKRLNDGFVAYKTEGYVDPTDDEAV